MLNTIVPRSTLLQKYIDSFYLFNAATDGSISYLAFPHTNTGLSFFKGVSISRGHNSVQISEQKSDPDLVCIEILGKYMQPVFVNYQGTIEEISIVFKPLGINRFIREDHSEIAADFSQPFYNEAWLRQANLLFSSEDKIEHLEQFLLSIFQEKDEFELMQKSIDLLQDESMEMNVSDVAAKLDLNLKTFQRSFKKIMACSPSDYRRIAKFRHSLHLKFHSNEIKTLTNITYESNYSDQSYFIREFRKLTNQNPGLFFKEARQVDGDKIIWEIL